MKSSTEIYDFLSSIISAAPYGIIAVDMIGEVLLLNEQALRYLEIGHSPNEVIEKKLVDFLPHLPQLANVVNQCINFGRENFDVSETSPGRRHLTIRGRQILNGMILTIEDVTATKEVERATLNAMLDGQEKERRRWAQEIHDGIGPVLSSIKMNLDEVQEEVYAKSSPRYQDNFETAQELLKSVTRDLRSISHDLMPSALEDFGLVSALDSLCKKFQTGDGPALQFIVTGEIQRLNSSIELALYRAGQELLHNALKYAKATRISLQLIKHRDSIVLMVEDDGIGFNKNQFGADNGIGLKNIATRIQSTGGDFVLETEEAHGTMVIIEIPL
ncbi:sensor histidine kinase [Flavilitoribacter nigricans]|uniref:Oxygen sensor histidine kinase NreB n=1 Tax=Flavilitoribacter nigricans (strain ATCC 23147 / DSM 23189 / NBRC 102662 / NCIMB 1420 / SS-2) TaxID=1122177 RepID=A0A2D0MXQ2_FLAN2|nr:histidine kinase [Flavilitoribacter nigricans]PHN00906.1 hypothetical protein CRP01_39905 [Flavilitoribacter nigricans DSM 23189 = NBRC 102662]